VKLFSRSTKKEVGTIGVDEAHDKVDILGKFQHTQDTTDDVNLKFIGDVDGMNIGITIPRGTWDIMEAVVGAAIKYIPGDIIEIGMGESTEILATIARDNNVNLYSCDIEMGGMFKVFDKPLFENHYCFTDGSDAFMEEFGGNPSIVFIDGEHLYETVKKEAEFFLPKIRSGGIMLLHDTMPVLKRNIERDGKGYNPGDIYKVRQELERDPKYDVFTWPYSAVNMGLTMVMVHDSHRSYWRENGRVE